MMDITQVVYRGLYDPPSMPWVRVMCECMVVLCLVCYVVALYDGRWCSAAFNALWVVLNAMNAHFNTLPLSERLRVLQFLKLHRR